MKTIEKKSNLKDVQQSTIRSIRYKQKPEEVKKELETINQ